MALNGSGKRKTLERPLLETHFHKGGGAAQLGGPSAFMEVLMT